VESGADVREEIFKLATARHWSIRELSQRRATLEDVFVEITHSDPV
jgi:ABC-2 type transport system ATP-binding protein